MVINIPVLWYIVPLSSVVSLFFAFILFYKVKKMHPGNSRMQEIAGYVREGAFAYLKQQYKGVLTFFAFAFALFCLMSFWLKVLDPIIPFAFLTGGFFSGLAGFIGMNTATMASSRTTQACSISLNSGLKVAFRAGSVMGLVVVGLALLDIAGKFFILNYFKISPAQITAIMLSSSMGASTQALFARLGGGIYTKAADVGADLVGKVEAGIPEDDPRNPATIADNVGDNVGDIAGMGADLFESYTGSILATASLGLAACSQLGLQNTMAMNFISAPMILAGFGAILSIFGIYLVKAKEDANINQLLFSLNKSVYGSSVLIAVSSFFITKYLLPAEIYLGIFFASIFGLIAGILIGGFTELYTSYSYHHTQGIAKQADFGPATVILEGIAVGMRSTFAPVITISVAILGAFAVSGGFNQAELGLYGIGFGAVGMLATLGVTLAMDSFGPIADNAGGNAEMSKLDKSIRIRTDALDSVGNTTAATGKGFAIGSAALTAMALLAAYIEEIRNSMIRVGYTFVNVYSNVSDNVSGNLDIGEKSINQFIAFYDVSIMNPRFLVGLFIGSMITFYFSALTIKAVGVAAGDMVKEVRRQFKEIPGIIEGTGKPDYARCVKISTIGAQREMLRPALVGILTPIIGGLILGVAGVLGIMAGALCCGFVLAVMMNNAGGAWDNAKKFIETGHLGGKGSEMHKATVVGDTVGDPFKDTAGPCINILIKLMSMVSIVFAGLIISYSPYVQKLYTRNNDPVVNDLTTRQYHQSTSTKEIINKPDMIEFSN